jgi:hypothetical protein
MKASEWESGLVWGATPEQATKNQELEARKSHDSTMDNRGTRKVNETMNINEQQRTSMNNNPR